MIKLKIDKNRQSEPILKIGFRTLEENEEIFLKRILMEGKTIKGLFKYEIPLKYLIPIINNISKENIKIDHHSKEAFLEFSDIYDDKYYYTFEVTPKYMKKWRQEECPNIFKIELTKDDVTITKEIVFKKISRD